MSAQWLPSMTSAEAITPTPEGLLASLQHGGWLSRVSVPRENQVEAPCDIRSRIAFCDLVSGVLQRHFCQNLVLWGIQLNFTIWWEKCRRIWEHVLKPQQWCLVINLFSFTILCFLTMVVMVRPQSETHIFQFGEIWTIWNFPTLYFLCYFFRVCLLDLDHLNRSPKFHLLSPIFSLCLCSSFREISSILSSFYHILNFLLTYISSLRTLFCPLFWFYGSLFLLHRNNISHFSKDIY